MPKSPKSGWQTPYEKLRPWTVMVYMVAGDTPELDAFAVRNLREMENGVNNQAAVVVQINRAWPDTPQRYEIRPKKSSGRLDLRRNGESVLLTGDGVIGPDMGDPDTLTDFLGWAVDTYPAQHYLLVLWGHAFGLGFGRDHNDPMTLQDLQTALKNFRTHRARASEQSKGRVTQFNPSLDILGTNACAMSYLEAAYEFRACAQYMVASQISVPFAGWPYDAILKKIKSTTTALELSQIIVNSYTARLNTPLSGERVEMTILCPGRSTNLQEPLNKLSRALKAELLAADDQLLAVRDAFLGTVSGDVRPLIDLQDLCEELQALPAKKVVAAAHDLKTAVRTLIVPPAGDGDPANAVAGLGGVGIFAPFVTDAGDLKRLELDDRPPEMRLRRGRRRRRGSANELATGKQTYFALDLFDGNDTWPRLVYDGLRQEIPDELLAFIESVGVTNQSDRIGVAQIIISIESWFNKFDRVLNDAQEEITAELRATFPNGMPLAGHIARHRLNGAQEENNVFGPPSLELIKPDQIAERTKTMREVKAIRKEAGAVPHSAPAIVAPDVKVTPGNAIGYKAKKVMTPPLIDRTIGCFKRVESALAGVERATTRGLTHGRFGLGPVDADGFGQPERFKGGFGEHPKDGEGLEHPKDGEGPALLNGSSNQVSAGKDSGLEEVAALYALVGKAMQQLEQYVSDLESVAAATLTVEGMGEGLDSDGRFKVISREIARSFGILREGASTARRTVRRVVAHPIFGLGPGPVPFGQDAREELAVRNGLGRQNLQLLSRESRRSGEGPLNR